MKSYTAAEMLCSVSSIHMYMRYPNAIEIQYAQCILSCKSHSLVVRSGLLHPTDVIQIEIVYVCVCGMLIRKLVNTLISLWILSASYASIGGWEI